MIVGIGGEKNVGNREIMDLLASVPQTCLPDWD